MGNIVLRRRSSMIKRLFLVICICLLSLPLLYGKEGKHIGEQKMLDVNIEFLNPYGKTVTNSGGVFYHYYGCVFHESKVYPSMYWGEYPLYFVGLPTNIKVTVTNRGPRAKAKLRIKTESYVLKTDGSSGMSLMEPKIIDFEVAKGETKSIDSSFTIQYQPGMESGLDRFIVKVLHINKGGGPGNYEPALIMKKEGVFCPPEK
jgi:hypothetical protein